MRYFYRTILPLLAATGLCGQVTSDKPMSLEAYETHVQAIITGIGDIVSLIV